MYTFDNDSENETETNSSPASSLNSACQDILSIVVRMCGLILLFIGMWIAIQVFYEALSLYRNPANIERMAIAIESGSNIDKIITPVHKNIAGEITESKPGTSADVFRISYFIAWVIDLLLLLLLARIAIMAIKTGGELTLYDAQIKKFAGQFFKALKQLNKE